MIFGNLVTGVPFGIFSMFGFFAASGVAVNVRFLCGVWRCSE